jgi:hypothetical protein
MKIKDIISEQGVWQGVKTVGKGLGQIAGGAAMGALRGLDKLGGGKGQVGTATQQAAYAAANKAKQMTQVGKQLPAKALAQFQNELTTMGIDLADARTFHSDQIEKMLEQFALQFFGSGEPEGVMNYIMHHANSVPMPTVLNPKSAQEYLNRMNQLKQDAIGIVKQTGKGGTPLHPASTTPIKGISLINDFPAIIKYNNENYSLNDQGQWESDDGVVPKRQWQMFLYKQADLLIPGSEELNKGFDKLLKQGPAAQTAAPAEPEAPTAAPAEQTPPIQVKVKGELITKNEEDGKWYDENGDFIGNPADIAQLEKMATAQKYTRQSSIPKSQMPPVTWKTRKADEREAERQKRMGQLGAEDETV